MDVLDFPDAAGWESWLAAQHGVQADAWLRIAKRQRYSPRRPTSSWSKVNVAKVEALMALLKARTPETRAKVLARAVGKLAAQK